MLAEVVLEVGGDFSVVFVFLLDDIQLAVILPVLSKLVQSNAEGSEGIENHLPPNSIAIGPKQPCLSARPKNFVCQ